LFSCAALARIKSRHALADRGDVSTQIGAPIRILALVGLLAALAMGAWTFTAGRGGAGSSSSPSASSSGGTDAVAQHPIAAAKAVAGKLDAHNRATAAGRPDAVAAPAPKTAHAPVEPASPRHVRVHRAGPAATATGTPRTIAALLRRHRVVVVLLSDPKSKIDAYSVGEAEVGASDAKAGFLRVDVRKTREVAPFAEAYDVREAPTVLFFARPGKLVQKLDGFADHESVAQAAMNAARGLVAVQG
jgi:hypothetical protein